MAFFNKGLDIEKDRLRLVFNLDTRSYDVYQGNKLLSYDDLNKKSKKVIDDKNRMLMIDMKLLQEEVDMAKTIYRFKKLKSLGYSCDGFEYLGMVNGSMSREIEELLNKLVSEENVLLGIHRIGIDDSSEKIEDILINGLQITGHLGSGAESNISLKNNVSYYPNNKTIIKELMYADQYKNSKGSILIRIPDVDLGKDIFVRDTNGEIRLNPKYIVGYIPVLENHHLENIVTAKQFSHTYDYKFNEGNFETEVYREVSEHKVRR